MFAMFKKVAAKERICGFYSTGPKIRENDLAIAELFKWVLFWPLDFDVGVSWGCLFCILRFVDLQAFRSGCVFASAM